MDTSISRQSFLAQFHLSLANEIKKDVDTAGIVPKEAGKNRRFSTEFYKSFSFKSKSKRNLEVNDFNPAPTYSSCTRNDVKVHKRRENQVRPKPVIVRNERNEECEIVFNNMPSKRASAPSVYSTLAARKKKAENSTKRRSSAVTECTVPDVKHLLCYDVIVRFNISTSLLLQTELSLEDLYSIKNHRMLPQSKEFLNQAIEDFITNSDQLSTRKRIFLLNCIAKGTYVVNFMIKDKEYKYKDSKPEKYFRQCIRKDTAPILYVNFEQDELNDDE